MREILFRGKDKITGEWIVSDCISHIELTQGTRHILLRKVTNYYTTYEEVKKETVGQFTGLYDKNGTRIYEGDIVKYGDNILPVVFEQRNGTAYFGLVYSNIETLPFGHYQDLLQIEVIGNIHDNPELLEEAHND